MRTLNVKGEYEMSNCEVTFGADGVAIPGERIHLVLAAGVWSLIVLVQAVSGSTGNMKGIVEAVCPGGSPSKARKTPGPRLSAERGTGDL